MPASVIDSASSSKQLKFIVVSGPEERPFRRVLKQVVELLGPEETETISSKALRICIPALGSPSWGDVEPQVHLGSMPFVNRPAHLSPQDICYFLYALRAALQKRRHACASISLPSYLCDDTWGGAGWTQKLGWLSDACISLSAFSGKSHALTPTVRY